MEFIRRLEEIRIAFETGDTPEEIVEVLNANVDRLIAEDAGQNALQVGDLVSLDLLAGPRNATIRLQDLMGDHFLVLTWFRGNW